MAFARFEELLIEEGVILARINNSLGHLHILKIINMLNVHVTTISFYFSFKCRSCA